MFNEVRVLGEILPTLAAAERLFCSVTVEMIQKAFPAPVRFPTLAALKRHFPSVKPIMNFKAFSAPVRFPTFVALEGHFSCVESLMGNEGDIMLEGFAAFTAPIRLLSSVHSEMLDEKGFLAEGLPTLAALKRLFSSVYLPVSIKVRDTSKDFATVTAFAVLLLGVNGLSTPSGPGCLPANGSHLMREKTRGSLDDHCVVCT